MASVRKSSSSKGRSVRAERVVGRRSPATTPRTRKNGDRSGHSEFAVCISNAGYPAPLERRKLYRVLKDPFADQHTMVRVIDESGEDYLFPAEYFVRIALPRSVETQLRDIAYS
jgi:hypothetical protein